MNPFRMEADDAWMIRFERRSGRWVLKPRRRAGSWLLILEWAAVTAAACAILMGGLFAGLYRARPDFDLQSRAFADASVQAIADSLSPGSVFARAAPGFTNSAPAAFYADFSSLAALGPGATNQGCRGAAKIEPLGVYSTVTARYVCELRSGTRRAVVVISLGRAIDDWRITGFYVSPPRVIGGG